MKLEEEFCKSEAKPEMLYLRSELSQLEIIMNQELTQAIACGKVRSLLHFDKLSDRRRHRTCWALCLLA